MTCTEGTCFIRIIPHANQQEASIHCYLSMEDLQEELLIIAFHIDNDINHREPSCVFLEHEEGRKDIEVCPTFGEDKKFKQDIIHHGFSNISDLIKYLCDLARELEKHGTNRSYLN